MIILFNIKFNIFNHFKKKNSVYNLTQQPHLEIREGRHPCIARTSAGDDFIPNDTLIGIKDVSMDTMKLILSLSIVYKKMIVLT